VTGDLDRPFQHGGVLWQHIDHTG